VANNVGRRCVISVADEEAAARRGSANHDARTVGGGLGSGERGASPELEPHGASGGFPGLAFGLVGGVLALVVIFRRGERALTVFAAFVPFLNALGFVLGSLLIGE
jgi:hypothetical protein